MPLVEGESPDERFEENGVAAYLQQYLANISTQAECVAKKLGAPRIRVDFFIPPPAAAGVVPVVLNEVEYNGGVWWSRLQIPQGPWPGKFNDHFRATMNHIRDSLVSGWGVRDELGGGPSAIGLDIFKDIGCAPKEQGFLAKCLDAISSLAGKTRRPVTPESSYQAMLCGGEAPGHGASQTSTSWWMPTSGANKALLVEGDGRAGERAPTE